MSLTKTDTVSYGKPLEILSEELIKKIFDVDTKILNNCVSGLPLIVYAN